MKITIYTVETCKFSAEEKEYLKSKNLPFEEKDVEKDHAALENMLKIGNNFAGTPVTEIVKDDGTTAVLKGFTKEEFEKELTPPTAPSETGAPAVEEAKPADGTAPTADPNAPKDPNAPPADPNAPVAPGMPSAPPADPSMPPAGAAPAAPGAAAPNPLDSILQDLQSKIPPPTLDAPPSPGTPSGSPPAPPAEPPQAPPMPPAPGAPADPGVPPAPAVPGAPTQ